MPRRQADAALVIRSRLPAANSERNKDERNTQNKDAKQGHQTQKDAKQGHPHIKQAHQQGRQQFQLGALLMAQGVDFNPGRPGICSRPPDVAHGLKKRHSQFPAKLSDETRMTDRRGGPCLSGKRSMPCGDSLDCARHIGLRAIDLRGADRPTHRPPVRIKPQAASCDDAACILHAPGRVRAADSRFRASRRRRRRGSNGCCSSCGSASRRAGRRRRRRRRMC